MTSRARTFGFVVLVSAALLVAVFVWLLGGFDGPERTAERNSAPLGGASSVDAASADLAGAPTADEASTRRAADAAASAAPLNAVTDRWLIVDHDTGAPIINATVRCVDPTAEVRLPVVDGGAFEPLGVAPFLLEIAAPEYAARWIVIDDAEPCAVSLRRAGALRLAIVDEVGGPIGGITARFESDTAVFEDISIVSRAIRGGGGFGQAALDAVTTLQQQATPETFARFDPRHELAIGPADCLREFNVGDDGVYDEVGIPNGRRFRVAVDDAFIAHSEPAGVLDTSGDVARWVTDDIEVRAGETAQFRVVRRGSCKLNVSIAVDAPPMSNRELQFVLARVHGASGGGASASATGTSPSVNLGLHRRSGRPAAPVLHWAGLEPGEYDLALQWRRYGKDASGKKVVEYCMAQRHFTLAAGESLDFEKIGPDPGLLELEFVFVDEHTRADVTAPVFTAAERSFDVWSVFRCTTGAGELTWTTDTTMGAAGGLFRILGSPHSGRELMVSGADDALDGSEWIIVSGTKVELPSAESLRLRVDVAAAHTHPCSLSIVRPVGATPFGSDERFATLSVRRIDGSVPTLLAFVASDDPAAGLRAEARLAPGSWIVCAGIDVHANDDALFEFDHTTTARVPASPLGYHVFGRFEIAADTSNEIRLEAVDAASVVLMHDAADQSRLLECMRGAHPSVQFGGESEPIVDWWSATALAERDGASLLIWRLPADALVRFDGCDLEFRTGPPGSTVEQTLPRLGESKSGAQKE